jgi:diacylglycerol O-acyltransferase / wax synthase
MIALMATVEGVVRENRARLHRAWRRVRRRRDGRPALWIELAVVAWLYWLYDVINNLAPLRRALAKGNALNLLSLEQAIHLDPERALDHWLAGHATLALISSYYYFFAHGVVTAAALFCLWWFRPSLYPSLRMQLVLVNLIAFVVFWRYPLEPPRMFPSLGYTDVIATSHSLVSWHNSALVDDADQLAAMPSLHVAWAIWSGIVFWRLRPRRAVAVLAVAYPLLTSLVVIATGNHYLLDVIGGAVTLALAIALERLLQWARARARNRRRAAALGPSPALPVAPVEASPDGAGAVGAGPLNQPRRSAAPRR